MTFYLVCNDCSAELEIEVIEDENEQEPIWCPLCGSNSIRTEELDE